MNPSWLESAIFYQIYPQSFYDSNGDGIGDLPAVRIVLMEKSRYWKEGISKCQIPIILSKTTVSGWC